MAIFFNKGFLKEHYTLFSGPCVELTGSLSNTKYIIETTGPVNSGKLRNEIIQDNYRTENVL